MSSLKVLSTLVGIILVIGVAVAANNITTGCVATNERLVASRSVYLPGSWFGIYMVDIAYPGKRNPKPANLTRIVINDWGSPKNYAYLSVINGGPGKEYATVRLEVKYGNFLNCTVDFFGY